MTRMPRASSSGAVSAARGFRQGQEDRLRPTGPRRRRRRAATSPSQMRASAGRRARRFHRGRAERGRERARAGGAPAGAPAPGRHSRWRRPGRRRSAVAVPSFGADVGRISMQSELTFIHAATCTRRTVNMQTSLTLPSVSCSRYSASVGRRPLARRVTARCIKMLPKADSRMKDSAASRHRRARLARAHPQPGAAATAPGRARLRRHAGDAVARYQGARPGQARGRRRLSAPAARPPPGGRRRSDAAAHRPRVPPSCDVVQNLIVLRTDPGRAQILAVDIDRAAPAGDRRHHRRRRHDPGDHPRSRAAGAGAGRRELDSTWASDRTS